MIRSPLAVLAASLLAAAVLGGCGRGSKSTVQSTSPATTTTSTPGTTGATSAILTTQQALETCQREIHEASKLLLDQGSAIEAACASNVSAGSMTKVQKPTRELCEGAIKETSQSKSVIDRTLVECRNRTT